MKLDPLDNPTRNAATLHNLTHNFQAIGVRGWLEEVSFDQVVDAFWAAKLRKADREDMEKKRRSRDVGEKQ